MPARQPRNRPRIRAQITPGRMTNLLQPVQPLHAQPVRILLPPVDRSLLAIDAEPQPVTLASGHLRNHQHAASAVLQPEKGAAVVVQQPSGDHRPQRRVQARHLQARHILNQVEGMGANVADAAAGAVERRIGPPRRLLLPRPLQRRAQPPLQVFDGNLANLSQSAAGADGPRLAHQRIAGIGMRQRVRQAGAGHRSLQSQRLFIGSRSRFVAHHRKPRLQRGLGHRQVQMIGRCDDHKVDSVRPLPLRRQHLPVARIRPTGIDPETLARRARPLRRLRERPGHQLDPAVQLGSHLVHRPDEGSRAAANHSHAQLVLRRHRFPSPARRRQSSCPRPALPAAPAYIQKHYHARRFPRRAWPVTRYPTRHALKWTRL